VARIIVLDSGPLGDACRKRGKREVEDLTSWRIQAKANAAIIAIPEIADYEVRRGLLSTGATDGIDRLDLLRMESVPNAGSSAQEVRSPDSGAQPRWRRARSSRFVVGGAYDPQALRRRTPE
jgi:hypothetical protein